MVLVGIDGGSWSVIDPMLARGELPNFAALIERGVQAELATVEPLTSPVVWSSIATGRSPEAHGITDFYGTRLRMKTPTVFERLAAQGRRVGLYDYLMTWPPAAFPGGFVIPGWLRRDDSVTPADVWSRIALPPFVASYDDLRASADSLQLAQREVVDKAPRFVELQTVYDLEVAAVSFYAADMTSHRFWRAAYPEQFEARGSGVEAAHPEAIAQAMKGIDRSLGVIVNSLAPEDTLLIASDHGFRAADEPRDVWVTNFREVAASVGLEDQQGFSVQSVFGAVIVRVHPGPFEQQEALLDRLTELFASFRTRQGAALLPLNRIDVAERPAGRERGLGDRLRQWVTGLVVEYWFDVTIDPNSHAALFAFPAGGELAALAPDEKIEVAGREVAVSEVFTREEFTGAHDPVAIFLAAGAGIQHTTQREQISVLDIAPLIHYLAGDRIPDDLEGAVPTAFISPAYLAAHPLTKAPAADFRALEESTAGAEGAAGDELTEKLRALGYVE